MLSIIGQGTAEEADQLIRCTPEQIKTIREAQSQGKLVLWDDKKKEVLIVKDW